ncbi:hypothetical protein JOB18_008212 [Solea senegalensis]|uniref:Uncharacterized protein n=1 Tax=Solea senegalensis TaxID=28829 RepID=A0AAV6SXE8_SOLSE|nr:hypothetical protein JOB18_008212 [Solea senegalensis]
MERSSMWDVVKAHPLQCLSLSGHFHLRSLCLKPHNAEILSAGGCRDAVSSPC